MSTLTALPSVTTVFDVTDFDPSELSDKINSAPPLAEYRVRRQAAKDFAQTVYDAIDKTKFESVNSSKPLGEQVTSLMPRVVELQPAISNAMTAILRDKKDALEDKEAEKLALFLTQTIVERAIFDNDSPALVENTLNRDLRASLNAPDIRVYPSLIQHAINEKEQFGHGLSS